MTLDLVTMARNGDLEVMKQLEHPHVRKIHFADEDVFKHYGVHTVLPNINFALATEASRHGHTHLTLELIAGLEVPDQVMRDIVNAALLSGSFTHVAWAFIYFDLVDEAHDLVHEGIKIAFQIGNLKIFKWLSSFVETINPSCLTSYDLCNKGQNEIVLWISLNYHSSPCIMNLYQKIMKK